jgi:hypothetical protein
MVMEFLVSSPPMDQLSARLMVSGEMLKATLRKITLGAKKSMYGKLTAIDSSRRMVRKWWQELKSGVTDYLTSLLEALRQ